MSLHRYPSSAPSVGPEGLTRRHFLQLLGATTGAGAVMSTMGAWGQIGMAAQTSPPVMDGSGNGTKVIVVGAGPGGCPAAYELMKLGYDVTVIEARDRLGGHAFDARPQRRRRLALAHRTQKKPFRRPLCHRNTNLAPGVER